MVNSKKSLSVSPEKVQKMANKKEMLKPNSPEKMKRVTRSSSSRVLTENKKKPISPKKSKAKAKAKPKPKPSKKKPVKEDWNKPKKPPTAFFFFLEEFRKDYQEQNPAVTSMRDVGKAGGERWNSMIFEEKVKYYDMATEKRAEFDKAMAEYEREKVIGGGQDDLEDSEFDEF